MCVMGMVGDGQPREIFFSAYRSCRGEIVEERTDSNVRSQAQRLHCNSVQLQPHAYSGSLCQTREYG